MKTFRPLIGLALALICSFSPAFAQEDEGTGDAGAPQILTSDLTRKMETEESPLVVPFIFAGSDRITQITINGEPQTFSKGETVIVEHSFTLTPGENLIEVQVKDAQGRKRTKTYFVVYTGAGGGGRAKTSNIMPYRVYLYVPVILGFEGDTNMSYADPIMPGGIGGNNVGAGRFHLFYNFAGEKGAGRASWGIRILRDVPGGLKGGDRTVMQQFVSGAYAPAMDGGGNMLYAFAMSTGDMFGSKFNVVATTIGSQSRSQEGREVTRSNVLLNLSSLDGKGTMTFSEPFAVLRYEYIQDHQDTGEFFRFMIQGGHSGAGVPLADVSLMAVSTPGADASPRDYSRMISSVYFDDFDLSTNEQISLDLDFSRRFLGSMLLDFGIGMEKRHLTNTLVGFDPDKTRTRGTLNFVFLLDRYALFSVGATQWNITQGHLGAERRIYSINYQVVY
ncbi:MAG: hypothetical protein OEV94_01025 [Deltaproteobacteria bacterium]|nr:hypothetical protein [Deltaproteobacteria bacterium]